MERPEASLRGESLSDPCRTFGVIFLGDVTGHAGRAGGCRLR